MTDFTSPSSGVEANTPCDSATAECPLKHWFDLTFFREPNKKVRKRWWPVDRHPLPYQNEEVSIGLTGITPLNTLDSNGHIKITEIPSGTAQIVFYSFYKDIYKQFDHGTKYSPR